MNEREFLRLANKSYEVYARKIAALEEVWRMSNDGVALPKIETSAKPRKKERTGNGRLQKGILAKVVEEALDQVPQQFTVRQVEEVLKKMSPEISPNRSSLSHMLKRLHDEKRVRIVEAGRGKRPTMYEQLGEAGRNGNDLATAVAQDDELLVRSSR